MFPGDRAGTSAARPLATLQASLGRVAHAGGGICGCLIAMLVLPRSSLGFSDADIRNTGREYFRWHSPSGAALGYRQMAGGVAVVGANRVIIVAPCFMRRARVKARATTPPRSIFAGADRT